MTTTTTDAPLETFRVDACAGLARSPKELSPKYFYDRAGSELFDAICDLQEYYVTRAETSIMETHVRDIVARW